MTDMPLGTVVATMQGVWSNNATFTGSFRFAVVNNVVQNNNGIFGIQGNNLVIDPNGPGIIAGLGGTEYVTVQAVQ